LFPALAWGDPLAEDVALIPLSLHEIPRTGLSWDLPIDLGLIESATAFPTDPIVAQLRIVPRGNELSTLASVTIERSDRRFRAEVVEWFAARSAAAGLLSDVIVRGSDRGLHLHVRGAGQYLLLWETRF
jgi:hypothetical protein